MADQFSLCLADYVAQLQTLASTTSYFPAATGQAAGWQISEDDNVILSGSDYFITYRAGAFDNVRHGGGRQDNVWHVSTTLYMRFEEYSGLWTDFRAFRAAVLELPDTAPLQEHGIYGQSFVMGEQPGYLLNGQGDYMDFVVQKMDCIINQRVLVARKL